ncbi:Tyrosine-protein kinase YwqD [Dickeya dianthicola]|uniref:ParA family protein n=1 Tax=Dickeya dianthicola TaxID=204039 RepID=A0ABX9NIL1_9GAMM|nr:ParA family protein [Dickeya dianthicola]AYC17833.1 Tyrosine-protein kinase YwqD [Dickeya dianthicola]MBI0440121.1 ParA family protein [Dickeya dianthicola]MBI0451086.1 ParA family protein [Dickeya dianthicola]MBI0455522.1 ParA family protein [Dickeya dianthicola]MBI0459840.1 ParA family protein [Dickeya dianthicola]
MHVIPVISTKGGEGKSTQAANLAGFLADAGLITLLIDGDYSQPTASSIYALEYEAPFGLFELLMQTADLGQPDTVISRTVIKNLDLIISNDPDDRLSNAMLHAPDGRMRLRNILQHPSFQKYDVIIIDSKGAAGVMVELVVLAATESVLGVIKPILPDVREFMRGTVRLISRLLALQAYGIKVPSIKILTNCIENTSLDKATLDELTQIIEQKKYPQPEHIAVSVLQTKIDQLEVYKRGHALGQPVHRLEYKTDRKSPAAAVTIHSLACELFPEWKERFDSVLRNRTGAEEVGNA